MGKPENFGVDTSLLQINVKSKPKFTEEVVVNTFVRYILKTIAHLQLCVYRVMRVMHRYVKKSWLKVEQKITLCVLVLN